ncbi:putative lipid II flippase FtsW [Patescibacteria group bacterium]|nr:MAG: putative lipid II flippase FtsW [Patescibacteria group bacterium]
MKKPKVVERLRAHLQRVDRPLLLAVLGLAIFGLAMLSSASGPSAFARFGDAFWFVRHQLLFGFLPGIVVMFVLSQVDYRLYRVWAMPILLVTIVLLVLVFIPGLSADWGTSKSWIGIGGFSLQPAEIVKITFLIYLAAWLEARGDAGARDLHAGLVPFLTLLAVIGTLIMLQPDLGTFSVIVMVSLVVYFLGGASVQHLAALSAAGFGLILLLIKVAPYRALRLTTFLHPELDPQGVGYHINQALLAIGSGGLFGLGFGRSRQKFSYLPEVAGDSIFAVMAEELGFLLSAAFIVLLLLLFLWRGLTIADRAPDRFGKLLASGIVALVAVQAFVNIGSMLSVLPLTGITLPFVSYGGTSLVVLMGAMGILLNISSHGKMEHA